MLTRTWLGLGIALALAATASAQETGKQTEGDKPAAAEMDEQMAQWMALADPGPEHKLLEYQIGTWKATCKHWMAPGTEPMVDVASCTNEWVLGGRFVKTQFKGMFMDMPFEGLGYGGYDRIKKKFTGIWMDSFGTMIAPHEGDYDQATKTFTYTSQMVGPDGKLIQGRHEIKVVDPDEHIMVMYHTEPGGDEMFKVMEITYERIKGAEVAPPAKQ